MCEVEGTSTCERLLHGEDAGVFEIIVRFAAVGLWTGVCGVSDAFDLRRCEDRFEFVHELRDLHGGFRFGLAGVEWFLLFDVGLAG